MDTENLLSLTIYNGPEIPCLRIIKKCVSINTAAAKGNTNVCALQKRVNVLCPTLSPPRKTNTKGGPTIGTAAGTPVTILHAQNPT